ncbi:MAG TPA: hypothetical protein VMZ69_06230 [Saprospiraceae bacterium]|nr:hypothetical protein [Saprospiraceae bacterium]
MKKKTLLAFLIMIIGIGIIGYFTPWWVPVIWVIFTAFVLKLNIKTGMMSGALSFALVWSVMSRYMDVQDQAGIISKTGTLMGGISHQLLFVLVMVISLITGFLAGWFGSVLGKYFERTNS